MTTYEITFNEKTAVGKDLLMFLEQNKKYVKVNAFANMSEEEFDAKIQRAREQYARGEYTRVLPGELNNFLEELDNESLTTKKYYN